MLLLSNEDSPADTIRPRLDAAGANAKRVHWLSMIHERGKVNAGTKMRMFSLARDIQELEKFFVKHPECRLVIIDPISAYLGGSDGHNNAEVRALLAPLAELGRIYNVAIVGIMHLNKSEHRNSLNRMSGSAAFGAVARIVLVVVKDKDNPSRRLMLQAKNNLGEDTKGLAYALKIVNQIPIIEWENQYVTLTAESVFSDDDKNNVSEVNDAIAWLTEVLSEKRMPSDELISLAKLEGFSVATLRRAKKRVGVAPVREGFGKDGVWWCELSNMLNNPKDAHS